MVYLVCASKSLNLPSDPKAVAGVKSKVEQLAYQVAGFVETTYGVPLGKVTFDCLLLPDSSAGPALCDKAKEVRCSLVALGLSLTSLYILGSISAQCRSHRRWVSRSRSRQSKLDSIPSFKNLS